MTRRMPAARAVGRHQPDLLVLLGGAGRPRTCDRAIMSRFMAVQWVAFSVIVAAQVGCPVHLVASRLAGCAWWNDRENDRAAPLVVGRSASCCRAAVRNASGTEAGHT